MENVSVEAAMKKAIRIRTTTLLIIIPYFLPFGIFLTLKGYSDTVALTGTALCFVFSFIVGYIYNNIAMQRWRIWAFTNVRNVHELKDAAEPNMFVPKSKLYFKSEFNSASYKHEWEALQYRFDTPDEIVEDFTIPDTVTIRANRLYQLLVSEIIFILSLIAGTLIMLFNSQYNMALYMLLAFIVVVFMQRKRLHQLFSNNVCLYMSADGLQINSKTLICWADIHKTSFRREVSERKGAETFLVINHKRGITEVALTPYRTNRYQLNNIIQTYKIRHGKIK